MKRSPTKGSSTTRSHQSDPSTMPDCGRSISIKVHISHISVGTEKKKKNATKSFIILGKEGVSVLRYRWFFTSTRQLNSKKALIIFHDADQGQQATTPAQRGKGRAGEGEGTQIESSYTEASDAPIPHTSPRTKLPNIRVSLHLLPVINGVMTNTCIDQGICHSCARGNSAAISPLRLNH